MRWSCVVLLAGCYAPDPGLGGPCGAAGACPVGQVCGPAATCELDASTEMRWTFSGPESNIVFDPDEAVIADGLRLRPIDQLDDDAAPDGFGGGVGASWNPVRGLLEGPASQASFVSRVFDAGGVVDWSSISWRPERPSGKPLPDDGSETEYPAGNLDRSGLRLLLHMDPGAVVRDRSGMGHDGVNNGASYVTRGHFGSALALDNVDFVDHGTPPGLDLTGPFSVSAWVKRTALGQGFIISREENPPGNGWCLFFNSAGAIVLCVASAGTQTVATPATFTSTTDWYHIVATHNNGAQRIYVDGVVQASGSLAIDPTSSPSVLNLGKRFNDVSYLRAELDEVAVFARTLTAAEARELYLRGATRLGVQVRSCPDPACAGVAFVGPGGSTASWFQETARAALPEVALTPVEAPPNRFFQYRLALESDDLVEVPRVARVAIDPPHVFAGSAAVTHADPPSFSRLIGFSEEVGPDHTGSVRYQISRDGATWYYRSGAAWAIAEDLSRSSTAAEIDAGCASFAAEIGAGAFQWRAVLAAASGVQRVQLAAIRVEYVP